MVTQSDDGDADALYSVVGGSDIEPTIAIYTNHDPQTSETAAAQIVTQQRQILMPGGILPPV